MASRRPDLESSDAALCGTLTRFTVLPPDALPDERTIAHLRRRLNVLLFADLRQSCDN